MTDNISRVVEKYGGYTYPGYTDRVLTMDEEEYDIITYLDPDESKGLEFLHVILHKGDMLGAKLTEKEMLKRLEEILNVK